MTRRRRALFVDASQGASGDMILGALVDLGVPLELLRGALERLPLTGWRLVSRPLARCSLEATKVDVLLDRTDHDHRGWSAIRELIDRDALSPRVRERALRVFRRLIEAEARVHGRSPEVLK